MKAGFVLTLSLGALAVPTAVGAGGGPSPGVLTGWDGIKANDAVRYVALPDGTRTTLAAIRIRDGRVLRYGSVAGIAGVPIVAFDGTTAGLSKDGRLLVLASFPGPREAEGETRFSIVRVPGMRTVETVTLQGSFSFDALSPDAKTLFVVEYLTADGARYRVRAVDLETGRLLPRAIAEKGVSKMSGLAMTRATSRSGRFAYTLYRNDAGTAFVNALDTVGRKAICIELPWRGAVQQGLGRARLSVDPNGRTLRIAQPGVGTLATIDARVYRVVVKRSPVA